jgi:steroid delta-isomerase-like uncharacterized protein
MSVSPLSVEQAFVRAINAHDVHAVADLMSEDHVFIDSLGAAVRGKETMRKGWEGYFRMVSNYTLTIEETYASENAVVMLGVAHGTYSPDGHVSPENDWKTPAAFRAVIEDGKVKEWRVYADNEPIRQLISKNREKQ